MDRPSYDNRNEDELYLEIKKLLDDNPDLGRDELPRLTGAGERACRNRKKWYIREKNGGVIPKEKVIKYLQKAQTEKHLIHSYGQDWYDVINREFPGYFLCDTQHNDYGEKLYILLPKLINKVKVKSKEWDFYIGIDDEGIKDPCLTINIRDELFRDDKIIIVPIFDVHLGHFSYREKKFLSYINWIMRTPNVFVLLGGDMMENALDDGRGMGYDSTSPKTQYDELIDKLSPIAHKILCSVPGNHERRTYRVSGFEPMFFICDKLKIPYFDGPVLININAGGYARRIYLHHGKGNSKTKGGKLNSAQRPHKFIDGIHYNISGHVHDLTCDPETVIYYNPLSCTNDFYTRWTIIAPSYLGWKDTYAYRDEYGPPAMGGVACELFNDGRYKANFA